MNAYSYKKIDAFASGTSTGNPAACLFLGEGETLGEDAMLNIAKQHKGFVSEVVYCSGGADAGFALRYYSSECEVDFCGHGTIACMYSLVSGMWSGETMAVEQGGMDRVFNTVKLAARDGRVLFGGGAVERIVGTYYY